MLGMRDKKLLTILELEAYHKDDTDLRGVRVLNSKITYDYSPEGNETTSRLQVNLGFQTLDVDYNLMAKLKESLGEFNPFYLELSNGEVLAKWSAAELYEQLLHLITDKRISLTNLNKIN